MLGQGRLIAFIPVSDLDAARRFYETTLGLRVTGADSFAVVVEANGTMLRLTHVPDLTPQAFTIAGWQVGDMEVTIDGLVARGVVFRHYAAWGRPRRGSGRHRVATGWRGSPTPTATRCP
jgi:catechol 2,3-dioxygenase-like lactoylglutathione lyase family enzyme